MNRIPYFILRCTYSTCRAFTVGYSHREQLARVELALELAHQLEGVHVAAAVGVQRHHQPSPYRLAQAKRAARCQVEPKQAEAALSLPLRLYLWGLR